MSQLAEVTGFDRKTVDKRLQGLPYQKGPKGAHLYDASEALPILFIPQETSEIEKEMQEAQLRRERALAEKAEIDVAIKRKQLVPIDEVAATVAKEYAYTRARLLSIPTKLALPLARITDPATIKDELDSAIAEALADLVADAHYEETIPNVDQSSEEVDGDQTEDAQAESETNTGSMG
jgi:hypothetical protein